EAADEVKAVNAAVKAGDERDEVAGLGSAETERPSGAAAVVAIRSWYGGEVRVDVDRGVVPAPQHGWPPGDGLRDGDELEGAVWMKRRAHGVGSIDTDVGQECRHSVDAKGPPKWVG